MLTNRLKVILRQEQIAILLVVIHPVNMKELASLRFLKLNLEPKWKEEHKKV